MPGVERGGVLLSDSLYDVLIYETINFIERTDMMEKLMSNANNI